MTDADDPPPPPDDREPPPDSAPPPDGEPASRGTPEAGQAHPTGLGDVPVVWGLIAVNVAMLLVVEAAGGSDDIATMLRFGAQPVPLPREDLWRLATSMFLHFGLLHIAFNLWALWIFGPLFERLAGHRRFLALYLSSGLAGGAATAVFAGPNTVAAGASGAIFGLLGAFLVLGFRLRDTPQGQTWLRNALFLIAINVVFGLSAPSIGLVAHLGGLAGGAVVFAAEPLPALPGVPVPPGRRRPASRLVGAAVAIAVVSVAAAAVVAP